MNFVHFKGQATIAMDFYVQMTKEKCVAMDVCDFYSSDLLWPVLNFDLFEYHLHIYAVSFPRDITLVWMSLSSLRPV